MHKPVEHVVIMLAIVCLQRLFAGFDLALCSDVLARNSDLVLFSTGATGVGFRNAPKPGGDLKLRR